MKRLIESIFVLAFTYFLLVTDAFTQDILTPPSTNTTTYSILFQPWLQDTNPQPVVCFTHESLTWNLSRSPNIVTQQLWATFTIPYQWFFVQGMSNWVTNLVVSITNHPQEFFAIAAVNQQVRSVLP